MQAKSDYKHARRIQEALAEHVKRIVLDYKSRVSQPAAGTRASGTGIDHTECGRERCTPVIYPH